jgi:hypothetical protein
LSLTIWIISAVISHSHYFFFRPDDRFFENFCYYFNTSGLIFLNFSLGTICTFPVWTILRAYVENSVVKKHDRILNWEQGKIPWIRQQQFRILILQTNVHLASHTRHSFLTAESNHRKYFLPTEQLQQFTSVESVFATVIWHWHSTVMWEFILPLELVYL